MFRDQPQPELSALPIITPYILTILTILGFTIVGVIVAFTVLIYPRQSSTDTWNMDRNSFGVVDTMGNRKSNVGGILRDVSVAHCAD
jgi:hypothetical protein